MLPFLDSLLADFRISFRRLRQQPGFTAVAVLTLALGLGVNVAIFTLLQAAILQQLPVRSPNELVRLGNNQNCCVNTGLQDDTALFSYDGYVHLRDHVPELASLTAFQASPDVAGIRLGGTSVTEPLPAEFVSANYFTTLGVIPARGRLLEPADDRPGADPVFVMSHRAWQTRFGGNPAVVGAAFLVLGKPMTLVGISDALFFGETVRPDPPAIWLPLGQMPYLRSASSLLDKTDQNWLYAIGRLASGATAPQVERRATQEFKTWLSAQSFLDSDDRKRLDRQRVPVVSAAGGVAYLRDAYGYPLTLLFAMSLVVLLIAAANLANLLLARADPTQAALQTALGASSRRLVQQSLSEGLLLALAGSAASLLVARFAATIAVAMTFAGAQYVPFDVRTNDRVLLFAVGLAVLSGLVFSAAPAWAMSRTHPSDALAGAGRSTKQESWIPRRSLAVVQVALSLVALTVAGLLMKTLTRLELQPLGFQTEDRIVVRIAPAVDASTVQSLAVYYDRMLARLRRMPEVIDATFSLYSPMQGTNWSSRLYLLGQSPDDRRQSSWNRVGPRYFETLGTPVVRGRSIDERDTAAAPHVAVVNEAFVRRFFPRDDPLGHRLGTGGPDHASDYEIVGVAADVKYTDASRPTLPMIFFPALQVRASRDASTPSVATTRSLRMGAVELHVAPGNANLEPALRRAFSEIDPDLTVLRIMPLATQVSLNFRLSRLMATLTAAYGLLALVIAAIGLYGLTSYAVARRTREFGIRMALGADRSRVVRDTVRGALLQTGIGFVVGIQLAVLAASTLGSLLFGVTPRDPTVYIEATLVLTVSSAAAAFVPARRAASVDPARALRSE